MDNVIRPMRKLLASRGPPCFLASHASFKILFAAPKSLALRQSPLFGEDVVAGQRYRCLLVGKLNLENHKTLISEGDFCTSQIKFPPSAKALAH